MHHFLDPGPAILAEVAEVIAYPSTRPLDEQNIREAAEGCVGIVSQLKDPVRSTVLSTPGLLCVSNVAVAELVDERRRAVTQRGLLAGVAVGAPEVGFGLDAGQLGYS